MKLKEALGSVLTQREVELCPSAFDTVGDIAIFNEIHPSLKKKEKLIARTLLNLNKHIHIVLKKTGQYSGKLRTPTLKHLAGEKRKTTIHKENGVELALDVERCYFSTRTASERQRLISLVKKGESVLVMFSGIGVLPIEIAKHTKAKRVYGIELNPVAHAYAVENARRNKIKNIILLKGDVRKALPKLKKTFDRIVMPLPKEASSYLPLALKKLKPRGTIHLYLFASEQEIPVLVKEYKKKFKKVKAIRCGQYAPEVNRVRLDLGK